MVTRHFHASVSPALPFEHSPSVFFAVLPSSLLSDPSSSRPPCESTRCSSREQAIPVLCSSAANSLHHCQRVSIQSISCLITCVQTHGENQTLESSRCRLVLCLNSLLRCERDRTSCLTVQRRRCWRAHLEQFVRLFKVKTSPKTDEENNNTTLHSDCAERHDIFK